MNTSVTSIARLARQARAFSVPVLVAGALAAGCGTVSGTASPSAAGAKVSGTASAPAPAPSASAVPTVTGGPVAADGVACAGWPANAASGTLTAFFQPVAVERCVTAFQQIQGKGEWQTATLQKSTDNLATLTEVLLRPVNQRQPAVFCPEFAVIPPQIVLINSTGKEIIPRLPVGSCGGVDSAVLSTLESMSWQTLSVRLIVKIAPSVVPKTLPGASLGPGSPKVLRTASGLEDGQPVAAGTR